MNEIAAIRMQDRTLRMIFKLLVICSMTTLFIYPNFLESQITNQVRFTNLNSFEGFPSQEIFAISKDAQGFFWVGSTDGLFRFDGANTIQQFRANDPNIKNGLQSNDIKSICIDHKNVIWIGTALGGLTKYDKSTDTWETYKTNPKNENSISSNEILTILEDSKDRIWIGTEDGLNLYDPEINGFVKFLPDPNDPKSISAPAVISILDDHKGRLWVTAWEGGINLMIPSKDGNISKSTFRHFYPDESKVSQNVWKIYQDKENRFWAGTIGAGLFLMDIKNDNSINRLYEGWDPIFYRNKQDKTNPSSISSDVIFDIYECTQGYLWIASNTGLDRTDLSDLDISSISEKHLNETLSFEHFESRESESRSITPGNIYQIYEDDQGLIWFGTSTGLSQYNWYANQFKNWKASSSIFDKSTIKDIYVDDKNIWVASNQSGLLIFNIQDQKIKQYTSKNKNSLLATELFCLYSRDGENLYVGTKEGIEIIDLTTNNSKVIPIPQELKKEISHLKFQLSGKISIIIYG